MENIYIIIKIYGIIFEPDRGTNLASAGYMRDGTAGGDGSKID